MGRYELIVLTRPVPGREDEFNHWYQGIHMQQMLTCTGFKSGRRFKLTEQMSGPRAFPYLAIYDIEADDIAATLADMNRLALSDELVRTDSIDSQIYSAIFEAIGDVVEARNAG